MFLPDCWSMKWNTTIIYKITKISGFYRILFWKKIVIYLSSMTQSNERLARMIEQQEAPTWCRQLIHHRRRFQEVGGWWGTWKIHRSHGRWVNVYRLIGWSITFCSWGLNLHESAHVRRYTVAWLKRSLWRYWITAPLQFSVIDITSD